MDEPFSQVDALTAESLRAEVLDIWAEKGQATSSILMVSHDIKEVAYMADRIVVLSANPGRVRTVVDNRIPRPRDYRSPEVLRLVDQLHDVITGAEMPDAPESEPEPEQHAGFEPLPDATVGGHRGRRSSTSTRAAGGRICSASRPSTHEEFGGVINLVKAGEMLDLFDTPKRTVVLTPVGERFVKATPVERTEIWRERLLDAAPLPRGARDDREGRGGAQGDGALA